MNGFYLSATKKSSGKTLIGLGIAAALKQQGKCVQTFKKGPDYIDPLWHAAASERPCYNLDFRTQNHEEITQLYADKSAGCDLAMLEGNKGLYDGVSVDGTDSNAAMAALLGLPVVLVINCVGITRGVAPLVLGYQSFGPELQFAGVILNQVASSRHEAKLITAIASYADMAVLGAVPRSKRLWVEERHMGLIPSNEHGEAEAIIRSAAQIVTASVDLAKLSNSSPSKAIQFEPVKSSLSKQVKSSIKIGIARDAAFGFYYPDDIEALEAEGAQCVYFNTLRDQELPEVDALFIGGGFPETHLQALADNKSMLASIKQFIEQGGVTYAECGGLMYLSRSIEYQSQQHSMVGAIAADTKMQSTPQGRGYAKLSPNHNHPWGLTVDQDIDCHEFHYSKLVNVDQKLQYAYSVKRGQGIDGEQDGIIYKNLLANYCHQRSTDKHSWIPAFIEKITTIKLNNENHRSCR